MENSESLQAFLENGCRKLDRVCPSCETQLIVGNEDSDLIAGIAYCVSCDAHVIQNDEEAEKIIAITQQQGSVLVTPSMDEHDSLPTTPRSLTIAYHQRQYEKQLAKQQPEPVMNEPKVRTNSNTSIQEGVNIGSEKPQEEPKAGGDKPTSKQERKKNEQPSDTSSVKEGIVVGSQPPLESSDSSSSGYLEQVQSYETAVSQAIERRDSMLVQSRSSAEFTIPDYDKVREIAIDVLSDKMMQGYKISPELCGTCTMPLMANATECFVCLALRRKHMQHQQRLQSTQHIDKYRDKEKTDSSSISGTGIEVETVTESDSLNSNSSSESSAQMKKEPMPNSRHKAAVVTPVSTTVLGKSTRYEPIVVGKDVKERLDESDFKRKKNPLEAVLSFDSIMPPTFEKLVYLEAEASKLLNEVKNASVEASSLSAEDILKENSLPSVDKMKPGSSGGVSVTASASQKQDAVAEKDNEDTGTLSKEDNGDAVEVTRRIDDIRSDVSNSSKQKSLKELQSHFDIKRDLVSKEIGKRLAKGWMLLNSSCSRCSMPLLTDTFHKSECCILCGIVQHGKKGDSKTLNIRQPLSSNAGGGHSVSTKSCSRKPLEPTGSAGDTRRSSSCEGSDAPSIHEEKFPSLTSKASKGRYEPTGSDGDTQQSHISWAAMDAPSTHEEKLPASTSSGFSKERQDPPESCRSAASRSNSICFGGAISPEKLLSPGGIRVIRTRSRSSGSLPYLNVDPANDLSVLGDISADETQIDLLMLGRDQLSIASKSHVIDLSDIEQIVDDKDEQNMSPAMPAMTASSLTDSVPLGTQQQTKRDPSADSISARSRFSGRLSRMGQRCPSPGLSMARVPSLDIGSEPSNGLRSVPQEPESVYESDRSSMYHQSTRSPFMGRTRRAPSPGLNTVSMPMITGASVSDTSSSQQGHRRKEPPAKIVATPPEQRLPTRATKPNHLSPYLSKRPQFFVRRLKQADDSSEYVASIMKKPNPETVIDVEPLRDRWKSRNRQDVIVVEPSLLEDSRNEVDDDGRALDVLLSRIQKTKSELSRASLSDRDTEKRFGGLVQNLEQTAHKLRAIEQS